MRPRRHPHRDLHGRGGPRGASPPGGRPGRRRGAGRGRHRRPHHRGLRPAGVPCRAGNARGPRRHRPHSPRARALRVQLLPGGHEDPGDSRPPLALGARPHQEAMVRARPRGRLGRGRGEGRAGAGPSPARCHERHAGRRGGLPLRALPAKRCGRRRATAVRPRARRRLPEPFRSSADLPVPACPRPAHRRRQSGRDRARRHEFPGPRGIRHLRHPASERDRVRPGHRFRQSQRHRILRCRCPRRP